MRPPPTTEATLAGAAVAVAPVVCLSSGVAAVVSLPGRGPHRCGSSCRTRRTLAFPWRRGLLD